MSERVDVSSWWPPPVGSLLRRFSYKHRAMLNHVVSVFDDKGGNKRIVTAEFMTDKQRWSYEVVNRYEAELGTYWRDGEENPVPKIRELIEKAKTRDDYDD